MAERSAAEADESKSAPPNFKKEERSEETRRRVSEVEDNDDDSAKIPVANAFDHLGWMFRKMKERSGETMVIRPCAKRRVPVPKAKMSSRFHCTQEVSQEEGTSTQNSSNAEPKPQDEDDQDNDRRPIVSQERPTFMASCFQMEARLGPSSPPLISSPFPAPPVNVYSSKKPHEMAPDPQQQQAVWLMSYKMKQKPELLKESSGTKVCCVFRVPQSLADLNVKAYLPLIVSVGPYHSGENQLKAMEEHKWRYLDALVSRVEPHGVNLDTLFNAVLSMEDEIRDCYSEEIKLKKHELAELMVLDGCFVIELICRSARVVHFRGKDPIFGIPWLLPYVLRDLLRLENQIPFSVLQKIYDSVRCGLGSGGEAGKPVPSVVTELALKFFYRAMERDDEVMKKSNELEGARHLLDLFCLSVIPKGDQSHHQQRCNCHCLNIGWREGGLKSAVQTSEGFYSATKLHQAGIRIKIREERKSFLDIKFVNGVLQVPRISIDDFMASIFLNAIAFEQSYKHRMDYFTRYANFMGHLINTPADVGFLCDRGIIQRSLGNDNEVAQFFNAVCKEVVIDTKNGYLDHVSQGIEKYRVTKRAKLHARWAELWDKYFDSPWAFVSFLAAVAVIMLTAIQTLYAIHPKK